MAYTAGFSVNVGDPTKATDVSTLAANDDYLKAAVDAIMADAATPTSALKNGVTATTQSSGDNSTKVATTAYVDASSTDPGGSNTQIQFNNSGSFGGSANLTFSGSALTCIGTVTVGVDDTGHDIKFFGATSGKYMEWDESADQLNVVGTADYTDGNGNHVAINTNPATGQKGLVFGYDNSNNYGQINALHTGTEYKPVQISANADTLLSTSSGNVGIGTASPSRRLELSDSSGGASFDFFNTNSSQGDTVFRLNCVRSANSAYNFFKMYSGSGFGDTEFAFRGDGNAYADGSFSGSGADYQEFFESSDGSALEVGKSVVMDGNKVRVYNASSDSTDNIIGVVRPKSDNKNSALIGNTAWNHWTDKYLTDDYGVYVREDVIVWHWDGGSCYERDELANNSDWTPPEGATSETQSVRKLNPDYDESRTYIAREERDEWNLIGLLGQVQVVAGEPTRPTWIKMAQISESVDLWLVR